MILVNDNWEQVKDIQDGLQIIEKNLGKEFTEKFVSNLLDRLESNNTMVRNKLKRELYKYIGI